MEKLAIDKKLLAQILQEENRTHDAAIKELEEKIANLEQQMKSSSTTEDIQTQTPSEPAQEMPEPAQAASDNVNEYESAEALQESAQALLEESDRTNVSSEAEAPQEPPKKKKRGLF